MAQVSRSTWATSLAAKIDSNGAGGVTAQDVREVLTDLEDSCTWYDEADVSADTTPQLGGNLDVNGNKIVSTSNGNIDIEPNGTGNVLLGNFTFDADQTVGSGQDNYVLTYDHSAGTIGLEAASGGGGGGGGYTQEQIEDFVGAMATGGTQTLITVTYDDANSELDFVVENDLSAYDNSTSQFITSATAPVTSVASKTGAVTLAATDIASGTFLDARISQSSVTQHEAALSIASSQVTGTFGTSALADEAVTLAKMAHMATDSFLGRDTAGTGDVEVLSAATARSVLNVEDGADVTDETNVVAALDGATLTDVGTPASTDRILLQDVSDSASLKYATYSEFAASAVSTSSGAPSSTPGGVGLINIDTTNDEIYISTDTASSADWDGPVLTENSGTTLTDTAATTADSIPFFDDSDSDNAKQDTIGDVLKLKPEHITIAVSDETTALTTGTAKVTFRMPYAFTLTDVRASVTTAPTGAALTVDINEGGTTILSTKLTIDATEKTSTTAATAAVISDTSLADDAEMTIDIDQVGSTVAGAGLKVTLIGTQT